MGLASGADSIIKKCFGVERDVVVVETIGLDDEVSFEQSLRSSVLEFGLQLN